MQTIYPAMVNSPRTTLAQNISAGVEVVPVQDASKLPDPPAICTIGYTEEAETILYTGKDGNTLTGCTRGFQGTAKLWSTNTPIARYFTAYDHAAYAANMLELAAALVSESEINGNIRIGGVETSVYAHPATHSAGIITEDETHRFITDTERTTWNSKAAGDHNHNLADLAEKSYSSLTDTPSLGTAAAANTGTAEGTIPVLGSGGKLATDLLPAIAVTDTSVVSTEAAMLALTAETGDVCVRSDLNKSFILTTDDPTLLANWQELLTPTDAVLSVAGKTGIVTLTKADVGLSNVENTAQIPLSAITAENDFIIGAAANTVAKKTPAEVRTILDVPTTSVTDARVQKIDLSSQVQTASYRRSVIALCELTNTNPSLDSFSAGTLFFHCTNGLAGPAKADIIFDKQYNTTKANCTVSTEGYATADRKVRQCTFTYDGVKYAGIEFRFTDAEYGTVIFEGETNFEIFGLDYYDTDNDVALNSEVNSSINFSENTEYANKKINNYTIWHSGNFSPHISPTTVTESCTLALSHADSRLLVNSASTVTLTVPTNASAAYEVGTEIEIIQYGVGVVTVVGDTSVTVNSKDSFNSTDGQYAALSLVKVGTDEWLLVGALD